MMRTFIERINGPQHETALRLFMVIVLAHWAEHLLQAFQIYVLGWRVPDARGALGLLFPFLVSSELLHYAYALGIQFFHHVEHFLLQGQFLLGQNLFDRPVPTSLMQLWVPRVELHLFYNTVVFIPMAVAMYFHMFPRADAPRAHRGNGVYEAQRQLTRPGEWTFVGVARLANGRRATHEIKIQGVRPA